MRHPVPSLPLLSAALVLSVGLSSAAPGVASAATLSLTTDLVLEIDALPQITGPTNFGVLVFVSSGAGSFVLPAGFASASAVLPTQLFTGASLFSSLNVSATAGTISVDAGAGTGVGPILGSATFGVLGGLINLVVPLSVVGVGGSASDFAAAVAVTVTGHGWTTGAAQVTGVTAATPGGGIVNTVTLSGYDFRTAGHAGTIQLVTPFRVQASGGLRNLPGFGRVRASVVIPEPSTFLLVGGGVLGLGLRGRALRRRRFLSRRVGS